ncbi:MAG TPA: RluA family pseudouridine synthase [Cellvibrio sp.]|nr:RluA family pseudouridine synthase [Cellvibrio sp.]
MPNTFDFTTHTSTQTAVDFLADKTGLPKARIKDAMNKGACWWTLKGKQVRLRRATKVMPQGTRIQLYYDEQVLARQPEGGKLILDMGRYSIWYKPHGMLAQGSQWGDHCSLLRWVELECKRECFLVHRLDADAAGLMIIAHDSKAAALLSQLFQTRDLKKYYLARVAGEINAKALQIDQALDGKESVSIVNTIKINDDRLSTLVEVLIETGRKHQIRRHLSGISHAIIGDRLYGNPGKIPLQLLAYKLEFRCPITKQLIQLELPNDLHL